MWKIILAVIITIVVFLIITMVCIKFYISMFLNDRRLAQTTVRKNYPENAIVFLGDSLTHFYPLVESFTNKVIVNRGIANDKIKDIENRLDNVLEIKPSCICLQAGINDFIHYIVPIKPERITNKLIKLIEKINENTKVKVLSLYPVNRRKYWFSPLILFSANNKSIKKANDILKKYCVSKNIEFIDVYPSLCDEKGNLKREYTIEGLHISSLGYEKITSVLKEYINE